MWVYNVHIVIVRGIYAMQPPLLNEDERRAIYRSLTLCQCEIMDLFLLFLEQLDYSRKFGGSVNITNSQQNDIPKNAVFAA